MCFTERTQLHASIYPVSTAYLISTCIERQYTCVSVRLTNETSMNSAAVVISNSDCIEEEAQSGTSKLVHINTRVQKSESYTVNHLNVPQVVQLQCVSTCYPVLAYVKSNTQRFCTSDREGKADALLSCQRSMHTITPTSGALPVCPILSAPVWVLKQAGNC